MARKSSASQNVPQHSSSSPTAASRALNSRTVISLIACPAGRPAASGSAAVAGHVVNNPFRAGHVPVPVFIRFLAPFQRLTALIQLNAA